MADYRVIIAYLSDAATAADTLGAALIVGQQHGAHIGALHVRPLPETTVPLIGEGLSATVVEEMLTLAETRTGEKARQLREIFDKAVAERGVPTIEEPHPTPGISIHWDERVGREEDVLTATARLSDLIVMSKPSSTADAAHFLTLNAGLMESGKPLLLIPHHSITSVGKTVVVFWNGSVEATRAVTAGLPFLEKAEKVVVFSGYENNDSSPNELAAYLAWRGIKTSIHAFPVQGNPGEILLQEAGKVSADMVIMGAYTHSRLRQLIFGGVTSHMLQAAEIPILFCH
ncbi:universal stress protein UspA [Alphaproteobacteria bacterium]|nr:universal stress protein UspA [Alphaproteobacteria bacterium]